MIGTHPDVGFKFGRWLDTVMMQRALGEGGDDAAGNNVAIAGFASSFRGARSANPEAAHIHDQ